MSPETETLVPLSPPEIVCDCPPSHRRLRAALSVIVTVLVLAIIACLIYLRLTGGGGT